MLAAENIDYRTHHAISSHFSTRRSQPPRKSCLLSRIAPKSAQNKTLDPELTNNWRPQNPHCKR